MATVSQWTPFGVALDLTATAGTVTRTSATQYTVVINASWATHYSGAQTNYGMSATSGGVTKEISSFGTKRSSGSGSFTGTYSISGNGSATKAVTVTFKNFAENWKGEVTDSASKAVSFNVTVPALTSYTVSYNANGGSGAPSSQTKWKDQTLTLSNTKPTRTGYTFKGWATSASGSVSYASGASYTANAKVTLYAVWQAITYTVSYNANGGSGAPSSQTKTYGKSLTLSSTKPTRTNYTFKGWSTSKSATTATYSAGGSYTANAAATLYAVWELAYTKPRVTGFTVARCDSAGNLSDSGTYAKVSCSWETDKTISAITVSYKLATASSYGSSTAISASGTSGTVSQVIGGGAISSEQAYDFKLDVADGSGSTYTTTLYGSISGTMIPIDFTPTGDGCGIGTPATESGVLNIAHETHLNGGLGMVKLNAGTDLNNVKTANFYSCLACNQYTNAPPFKSTATFLLEVFYPGQAAQVFQRAIACDTTGYYIAVRSYYASSGWGDWNTCIRGKITNTSWIYGRDEALLASTNTPTASQYMPLTSMKTVNGSWQTGTYQTDKYYITYTPDANYEDGANNGYVHGLILEADGTATFPNYVKALRTEISNPDSDTYYNAQAGDYSLSFGIGAGKVNRGIYDHTRGHWLLHNDATNTFLSSTGTITLRANSASSNPHITISNSSQPAIYPTTTGKGYVGLSNNKWAAVYATNGTIQTSDRNQKENILDIDPRYEELFSRLRPVTYELKGSGHDRVHVGFIAQEIKEAMDDLGITAEEFAGYCEDIKVEYDEETGEEIKVFDDNGEPVVLYSLRYSEFIALNTRMIQKQQQKINDLESRLEKLEALLGVQ